MLKIHKHQKRHQSRYYHNPQLRKYMYYSSGLLSNYDKFPEHYKSVVGPKKKISREQKKIEKKVKGKWNIFNLGVTHAHMHTGTLRQTHTHTHTLCFILFCLFICLLMFVCGDAHFKELACVRGCVEGEGGGSWPGHQAIIFLFFSLPSWHAWQVFDHLHVSEFLLWSFSVDRQMWSVYMIELTCYWNFLIEITKVIVCCLTFFGKYLMCDLWFTWRYLLHLLCRFGICVSAKLKKLKKDKALHDEDEDDEVGCYEYDHSKVNSVFRKPLASSAWLY